MIEKDVKSILYTEEQLAAKVKEMGKQIAKDYEGKNLMLISVLKGSVIFMADLMRAIDAPLTIDFMAVSSYGSGTKTTGAVNILKDIDKDLSGFDVLIVEDILDSGVTLSYLTKHLMNKGAKSLKIATLLDKKERRKAPIHADYYCFDVPDEFIVGYGLDYDQKYRNLPYIGILDPEVYTK